MVTLLLVEEHQAVVLEELVEQEQILVHRFQVYLKQHLLVEEVVVELLQVVAVVQVVAVLEILVVMELVIQAVVEVVLEDQISVVEMVDQVL